METSTADKGPRFKIALVDDYEEIRDLVRFMIEAHMNAEVHSYHSGNAAIQGFRTNGPFDIVISDMNMADGNGAELYLYLRNTGQDIPFVFLTTEIPERHALLKTTTLKNNFSITKPFSDSDIVGVIKKALALEEKVTSYIPIHISLLRKIEKVLAPLYVKINDSKYVKVANENSSFGEAEYEKYASKQVTQLYTESIYLEQFIREFRKESLSEDAFKNAPLQEAAENVSINIELMRATAEKLGFTKEVVGLARDNLTRALALAKSHPDLQKVYQQFLKIERLGYADHCTLLVLMTSGLSKNLGLANPKLLRQLTFASVFHDSCLSEQQYNNKKKLLRMIELKENLHSKDVKEVMTHTARAADLVRDWDFCPSGSAEIIFNHHENPQGTGFPMGRKASEIDEMSALFIISEDLVVHIIDSAGSPDLPSFVQSRSLLYQQEPYVRIFRFLKDSIDSSGKNQKS